MFCITFSSLRLFWRKKKNHYFFNTSSDTPNFFFHRRSMKAILRLRYKLTSMNLLRQQTKKQTQRVSFSGKIRRLNYSSDKLNYLDIQLLNKIDFINEIVQTNCVHTMNMWIYMFLHANYCLRFCHFSLLQSRYVH